MNTNKLKTIFVSTKTGVDEYKKQGCKKIAYSECSAWVKEKLKCENYKNNHQDTRSDTIMVLNDGNLVQQSQTIDKVFKRFALYKTRDFTLEDRKKFETKHWTEAFRKVNEEETMKISEYKCIDIANKVYNNQKFYVEDLNNFVDLVRDNINRESIIELKHVLKIVEYPLEKENKRKN